MAAKFKTGDIVKIIAGASRGSVGRILEVLTKEGKIVVENVNSRSVRKSTSRQQNDKSRIVKNLPIAVSNAAHFVPETGIVSRVRFETSPEGKKTRVLVKTGVSIDV